MEQFTSNAPQGNRTFHFKVDGLHFSIKQQFVTGLEIRQLAGLPADTKLYLDMPHGWQDHYVSPDDKIDLAKPGIENFITLKHKVVIIVNGTPYEYSESKVSFEKIVEMAHIPAQNTTGYIVKYNHGPHQNPRGTMSPGTEVFVTNKMDFNVRSTHQS